jgi:hypothetical protein
MVIPYGLSGRRTARRRRLLVLFGVVCVSTAWPTARWAVQERELLARRGAMLQEQRPVERYSIPAGTIVAEFPLFLPEKADRPWDLRGWTALPLPPEIARYLTHYAGSEGDIGTCLMSRRLVRPDGTPRIVIVDMRLGANFERPELYVCPRVFLFDPGNHFHSPKFLGSWTSIVLLTLPIHEADDDRLTLYAGQPDASDSSRFAIPFTTSEGPGLLKAQIRSDDSIIWGTEFKGEVKPGLGKAFRDSRPEGNGRGRI